MFWIGILVGVFLTAFLWVSVALVRSREEEKYQESENRHLRGAVSTLADAYQKLSGTKILV